MKCKKHRENIILYLYDELDTSERADLEAHIEQCDACRQDLAYSKQVFSILDETKSDIIPEGSWEAERRRFRQAVDTKPDRKQGVWGIPRWTYAAASLVLVFALGIMAGRFWILPDKWDRAQQAEIISPIDHTLNRHFTDVQPILLDYANYSGEANGGQFVTLEKEAVQNLIIQNILLKRALSEKNPAAVQLLEDIDLVLRELANRDDNAAQDPALIKNLIEERDILFKMQVLDKI